MKTETKRCVRCLCKKIKLIMSGDGRAIIKCVECRFNVTDLTVEKAMKLWNGFRVWELVP